MEQIFFRLHVRSVTIAYGLSTPRSRAFVEKIALFNAFVSLFILLWLHHNYISSSSSIISSLFGKVTLNLNNITNGYFNSNQSFDSNCLLDGISRSISFHSRNNTTSTTIDNYDMIRFHVTDDMYDTFNLVLGEDNITSKFNCSLGTFEQYLQQAAYENWQLTDIMTLLKLRKNSSNTINAYGNMTFNFELEKLFNQFLKKKLQNSVGQVRHHHHTSTRTSTKDSKKMRSWNARKSRMLNVVDRLGFNTLDSVDSISSTPSVSSEDSFTCPSLLTTSQIAEDQQHQINRYLEKLFLPQKVFLFSLEKGYLQLLPEIREKLNITVLDVSISKNDRCFGPSSVSWLFHNWLGYDTIMMNWAITAFGGRGHLYNVDSKEVFNLNVASDFVSSTGSAVNTGSSNENLKKGSFHHQIAFKIGVLLTTLFLFFSTTTLVSFTLRETQERMLKFTFLLQHHISHRIPYAQLIFTHVVESLVFVPIVVGILFFLFEFFSDQLLAFLVLSVVWMAEIYSVVR